MHVCSIATPDHLARARVLARSLAEQHPEARLEVLVIGDIPAGEPFGVLVPEQLGVPGLAELRAAYRPFELACALKPWLLRHALERSPAVLYLDADTRVYAPLDGVLAAARQHGLVLTRHLYGPLPRDGRRPSEEEILLAGAFNAGFLAAGRHPDTERFLTWWAERLAEDCTVDTARGLFADQRWLDLAPGLVPGHAVADAGCNLAYWDLPNRPVSGGPGAYRAGDGPLRTFHFSGFDPERPEVLSAHQDRVDLAAQRALARLLRDYARELLAAGHGGDPAPPDPAFGTPLMRRLYREGRASGALREPLSPPAGQAELVAWLREPAGPGAWAGLSRHLVALHAASPHLQAEFPDLDGADAVAYAEWARAHAGAHPELPAALAPPEATLPDGRPLDPLLLTLFARLAAPLPDFLAWLREPAPEGADAGVTRYLYELYLARPDLRAAFPQVGPELVAWARTAGAQEHALLADYASSDRAGAGSFE